MLHPRREEAGPHPAPRLEPELLLRAERALRLTPDPRRNRVILHLTIAFGCMPGDLEGLGLADVDLAGRQIHWRRANGWARLSDPLVDDLAQYLDRERRGGGDRFLLTRLGHPVQVRTLALFFRRLARELGDARLTPAALRRRRFHQLLSERWAGTWLRHGERWLYLADPSPLADPVPAAGPGAPAAGGEDGNAGRAIPG